MSQQPECRPVVTCPNEPGESVAAEMAASWQRGDRLAAEHFLSPLENAIDGETAARIIYEEVCLRRESGEIVQRGELLRRFPNWRAELDAILECDRLLRGDLGTPVFPKPGELLGDFYLLSELGRGGQARVFLARQEALADRPVVLKVTPRGDLEFLSLARLQHSFIIPLHGAYDFPDRDLRALCLPYLGGATLARLLDQMQSIAVIERTGRTLIEGLDQVGHEYPLPPPVRGPRQRILRASYQDAICWIGACLAEGLHYAHERGIIHLDIKPSNVLLAADAQPLLLDFHLARHPVVAGHSLADGLGGTLSFMSPEQQAVYTAGQNGLSAPVAVDNRSDIYSLGRLLYLALSGMATFDPGPLPPLRRHNPTVSPGLAAVIGRCMADSPANRYPDAAAVAVDLRRHLADLPLLGVANRSLAERWRKWRRRRPYAPLWIVLCLTLVSGAVTLTLATRDRVVTAQEALLEAEHQTRQGEYAEAIRILERGQSRVAGIPGCHELTQQLDARLRQTRRAIVVLRFHDVAQRLRFLVGAENPSKQEKTTLEALCRSCWEMRHHIADQSAALEPFQEHQAREDLLDVALLWADLKRRQAPPLDETVVQEVSQLLNEAEELFGPGSTHSRSEVRSSPRTAQELILAGRTLLQKGDLTAAAGLLEQAACLCPSDFWARFYGGVTAQRQGQFADAARIFDVAVALAPTCPEAYYNRGLAHSCAGQPNKARRDYDRALFFSPNLGCALLNRGVLHYQSQRYEEAIVDLRRALQLGADPAASQYNLALVYLALNQPSVAAGCLAQALEHAPGHRQARALFNRLSSKK